MIKVLKFFIFFGVKIPPSQFNSFIINPPKTRVNELKWNITQSYELRSRTGKLLEFLLMIKTLVSKHFRSRLFCQKKIVVMYHLSTVL